MCKMQYQPDYYTNLYVIPKSTLSK